MASTAPWRQLLQSHITENSSSTFTITTIDRDAHNRPVPRARTCEFRGFWPNPSLHHSAVDALNQQCSGPNPAAYESDMLSLTTDVRMAKVPQIDSSGHVVEALFWLKDTMNQWRIRGEAYVIGDPNGGETEDHARKAIFKGMWTSDQQKVAEWTWERQVTSYFANHSPVMRGSFKNPPPGQPRSQAPSDSNLRLGQKVEDLHDAVARSNFRVVVVQPLEVERLDLSDLQNVRRQQWSLVEDNGESRWEEVELWP